ncbi:helix-turn-helix domain-containing protein [Spirochaeta africana]|uniref:Putative nucleoside-diphosphate sugar epimerase n=1 Tax=Spirochaeta africana (strain ATCC 700263 / DSM 8902 / Z-7692) TaxID=889378 RepID=H9UM90_SPIAZ|nr:helix-turn-helix transcriptional regulator [Spirochaeta africana]AFG38633.1 putative nucleoside-diphosphate sugar epimerase [Spirochaeta africana DSM 8902]
MDNYLHRLDILLAKRGWNRKQLAMESGINVGTVQAYWSKNRPPKAEDLIRISRTLGTTAEYIMTGDNPPADTFLSPEVTEIAQSLEKLSREELIEVRAILRAYSLTYFRRAIDRPLRAAENPDHG